MQVSICHSTKYVEFIHYLSWSGGQNTGSHPGDPGSISWCRKYPFSNCFYRTYYSYGQVKCQSLDCAPKAVFVVQWLSHPPNTRKVPGSIPGENRNIFCHQGFCIKVSICHSTKDVKTGIFIQYPAWSSGQDTWLSPRRPGFNSRCRKILFQNTVFVKDNKASLR